MFAVYGAPPWELAEVPTGAVQTSPLSPGAADLGEMAPGSLQGAVILAPPGAVERRFVLAQVLTALAPGAPLTVLAPKDKGGSRLGKELAAFGCEAIEAGKRHHRICATTRPDDAPGLAAALAEGAPRQAPAIGWTQPGIFSWDRIDPGTALLLERLPRLSGTGADFGCGTGVIARQILAGSGVTALKLVDIDRRAVACARRNLDDPRVSFDWADVRTLELTGLDFVVMNPPFHDGGAEDKALGQAFIAKAAASLKKGGVCWLVANRHLPYEAPLAASFKKVRLDHEARGYKVFEAEDVSKAVRLDRLLANLGYGSRKQVADMIEAGWIVLDGAPVRRADDKVVASADLPTRLKIRGAPVDPPPGLILMLNKPLGVTCSHKEDGALVYDLLPERWRRREPAISTVGRLDKETSGLLLMTDDGALLHRIISPKAKISKRYRVEVDRPLEGDEAAIFASGTLKLESDDKPLLPAALEVLGPKEAWLTLDEGRYHQVRRMFAAVGNHVTALHRDRIGGLDLPAELAPGSHRLLSEPELTLAMGTLR